MVRSPCTVHFIASARRRQGRFGPPHGEPVDRDQCERHPHQGEADEASDVDFLVEMEPGRSLLDLGGLQVEFESLLGRHVDVVTVRGLKARIRNTVLTEAVPV